MDSNTSGRDTRETAIRPSQSAEKLVMQGVITHEKLLGMIKERNPIIARRDERRR